MHEHFKVDTFFTVI